MRKISLALLCLLLLASALPLTASANSVPDIVFSDAWFGDQSTRIEVAPGDKNVQLTIELVNTMDEPLRYVEGVLYLPEGFKDSKSGEVVARPSVSKQVPSGERFYLSFLLDIGDQVKLGEHETSLALKYVEWDEDTITIGHVKVRFRITGRSILKPVLSLNELEPGGSHDLQLTLKNVGSAYASSVEVWIRSGSSELAILKGEGRHFIGSLAPSSSLSIPLTIFVSRALADSVASLLIDIRYQDSYGRIIEESHDLLIRVKPLGGVGVLLDALVEDPILKPAESDIMKILVKNDGSEIARDVNLEVSLAQLPNPPITVLEGSLSVKLGDLEPGTEKEISLKVFVNEMAAGGSYSIPVSITYADEEGRHVVEKGLTITVLEESRGNRLRIYASEYVRGGMIESANITVENISGERLEDITLTISPTAGWITLLGATTWNIPSLSKGEKKVIELKLYAPSETSSGSTIGEPFNLQVETSFREPSGQIRNENHLLGMYVKGIIDITLQEISVEKLGGEFLLVGRLLNEGTEKASYTRVELIGGDLASTKISYLGDVEPNAPILFNIPIEALRKKEGKAEVVLRVSYLDSLRNRGETVLKAVVDLPSAEESSSKATPPTIPLNQMLFILLIAAIIAAVAIYLVRRSRRVEAG